MIMRVAPYELCFSIFYVLFDLNYDVLFIR